MLSSEFDLLRSGEGPGVKVQHLPAMTVTGTVCQAGARDGVSNFYRLLNELACK
jgi:hypothetical protein